MNAHKDMRLPIDDRDADHAMAFARTLGTTLQGDHAMENLRGSDPRPPLYTLDAFADKLAASEGVDLLDLEPMTTLVVRTAHSSYRIMVLKDTTVLLQGGCRFPDVTLAHLRGSGFGGYLLKLAWIGEGLRMEFLVDGKRFVTSTVRAIAREGDPATDRSPSRPVRWSYHR